MLEDLPICPENYSITDDGQVINKQTKRVLKHSKNPSGYHIVVISKEGKRKAFSVHRQLMLAFNFIPDSDKFEVNHIDGNKDNNTLDNLMWITPSDNVKHSISQLRSETVIQRKRIEASAKDFNKQFESAEKVAEYFDTHIQSVYRVLRGERKTLKGFNLKYLS